MTEGDFSQYAYVYVMASAKIEERVPFAPKTKRLNSIFSPDEEWCLTSDYIMVEKIKIFRTFGTCDSAHVALQKVCGSSEAGQLAEDERPAARKNSTCN